jgi:hypothetical protein
MHFPGNSTGTFSGVHPMAAGRIGAIAPSLSARVGGIGRALPAIPSTLNFSVNTKGNSLILPEFM